MPNERKFLGEILVERGIITQEQLKEAIAESKKTNKKIGDILVQHGWVREEDVVSVLSEQLGFAFIDVLTYQFDPKAVALVPKNMVLRLSAIPVYKIANTLTVAMANPLDIDAIDEIEKASGLNINPVFATASGIKEAARKYYGEQQEISKEDLGMKESRASVEKIPAAGTVADDRDLPKLIEEATQGPVIKLVNKIITDAVKQNASDIHLEPREKGFFCRYRIDGVLQDPVTLPSDLQNATVSRVKIMSNIDITERRLPQDGRTQVDVGPKEIDLRIATFPTIHGEHVSIRLLDKTTGILPLQELGLDDEALNEFKSVIFKPHGLILVTGPTGSGKSTTLYSVLNTIKGSHNNIITLEDPVEYSVEGVHQSQINIKAGLTFASGLRSIVRMDPDVIMIGEIRDKETAEIAIQAALTGHLVFATLHTNDAASAYTRLIDIGVEPYLVASSVRAVLAQRLVRRLDPKTRQSYTPDEDDFRPFGLSKTDVKRKGEFYTPGESKDNPTGYKGRIGIYEFLLPDDQIRHLILRKASSQEIAAAAAAKGMKTLLQDGFDKAQNGVTSLAEILRVTEEI